MPPTSRPPETDDDTSYWPLFRSAVEAALIAVLVQTFLLVWLGAQRALVSFDVYAWVVPVIEFRTTVEVFDEIVRLAAIGAGIVAMAFGISGIVRGHRLQVQAGRAFGFLDAALIGMTPMIRHRFVEFRPIASWMWMLTALGVICFAVAIAWVWVDDQDRLEV